MRELPPIELTEVVAMRTGEFWRKKKGVWTVNDKIFNVDSVRANLKKALQKFGRTVMAVEVGCTPCIHTLRKGVY